MTIKIKLSNDELLLVDTHLQRVYGGRFETVVLVNVVRSIILQIAEKFNKKVKNRIKKANLFDSRKKNEISLNYHEAWAIKLYLNNEYEGLDEYTQSWERNVFLKLINNLDQQLK